MEMEAINLIGTTVQELLLEDQDNFLVPAENVASLMYSNPLDHALLVLSKVGYSKIPVLDKDLRKIDTDNLAGLTVADVMEIGVDYAKEDAQLEDILHLLVNNAFLPIVNSERIFLGIITRKEVLKATNHLVHEMEKSYELVEKAEKKKDKLFVI